MFVTREGFVVEEGHDGARFGLDNDNEKIMIMIMIMIMDWAR